MICPPANDNNQAQASIYSCSPDSFSYRGWLPTLAEFTFGAIAGCHAGVPLLGCHCWVPLLRCHCWVPCRGAIAEVPLLGASYQLWPSSRWVPLLGAGCHAGVPLLGAIVGVPLLGANWLVLSGVYAGIICFWFIS